MESITFRLGTHRFHYRAAAVVIEGDHLLLHRLEGDPFWALPGGRVQAGEPAQDAIRREFAEELGLDVTCRALLSVGENFFLYRDEPHHEIGLYFAVDLPPACELRDKQRLHVGTEAGRRLEFQWFALQHLITIDMRPAALQATLASGQVPPHFVQSR